MNPQPSSFIIYDASAGSGKTFTLVRNYISDLLTNKVQYSDVLAITFTNKAVKEMKTRILDSLKGFSQHPIPAKNQALFDAVKEKTGLSEAEIQQKSKRLLIRILHNYAAFDVSTIDGFTHRILRIFAKDLNIPQNFEVQMETKEVLQEAVDRVISKAGDDKKLTQALVSFALYKTDDDKSWDITRDLNEIAKLITDGNGMAGTRFLTHFDLDDFAAFSEELFKEMEALTEKAIQAATDFFNLIEENGLVPSNFNRKLIPNYFDKVLQNGPTKPTDSKWVQEMPDGDLYKKSEKDEIKALMEGLRHQFGQLFETATNAYYRQNLLQKIANQTPSLSLLTAIQKEVSLIKEERKLLLISEFDQKISDSIKDEPAPFIYERLGERYSTYYIDEFQDTSQLQWQNLAPLIANTLASEGGKLTLVGDAKQSIYRWRGGKPEQFMEFCAGFNPFPGAQTRFEKLSSNYRSLPEVIHFNNDFFTFAAQYLNDPAYQKLFEAAPQKTEKPEGGYVELNFLEVQNNEERDEAFPQRTLEIIQRLTTADHPFGDICVLVRKRKQGVAIASYLNEYDIPIVTSETLLLANSPEVTFIIHLLNYVLNQEDKHYKYEILDYLNEHKNWGETNFSFIQSKLPLEGQTFFNALTDFGVNFNLKHLLRLPLYQAIEYCIRSFNLAEKPDIYIQFFLDFVYEYGSRNSGGIAGLLEDWELKKEKLSIIIPEGQNAVQIMTIHQAKGLEFPVVIYPYANEKLDEVHRNEVWLQLEEEPNSIPLTYIQASKTFTHYGPTAAALLDELTNQMEMDAMNVFYVAMTRAENQLYILSDYLKNPKPNSLSGLLVAYLEQLNRWDKNLAEQVYTFGEIPSPDKEKASLQRTAEHLTQFISSSPADHTVNMVTSPASLWDTPQKEALDQGLLIHHLLQNIHLAEDVPKTLEKASLEGILEQKNITEIKKQLQQVTQHPKLKTYFTDRFQIYTEKEILSQGEYLRLDRLCLKENQATIIDYKTGDSKKEHFSQINAYANAIQKMDYDIEHKILVYLNSNKIQVEFVE